MSSMKHRTSLSSGIASARDAMVLGRPGGGGGARPLNSSNFTCGSFSSLGSSCFGSFLTILAPGGGFSPVVMKLATMAFAWSKASDELAEHRMQNCRPRAFAVGGAAISKATRFGKSFAMASSPPASANRPVTMLEMASAKMSASSPMPPSLGHASTVQVARCCRGACSDALSHCATACAAANASAFTPRRCSSTSLARRIIRSSASSITTTSFIQSGSGASSSLCGADAVLGSLGSTEYFLQIFEYSSDSWPGYLDRRPGISSILSGFLSR
mmetsp:Transcript_44410/g.100184  ORF Transcript_44410/g.100184 Transcript_44410/m.100184 type:complete len:272 (-) Transcript_44410:127-942(-)